MASQSVQQYLAVGEEAWDNAWSIFHDNDGWKHINGKDMETGKVFSKTFKTHGKIFKLECIVDMSPQELFDLLVSQIEEMPNWSKLVASLKIITTLTDNAQLIYRTTHPIAKGVISPRDSITVRHWKSKDGVLMHIDSAVEHADYPPTSQFVRSQSKVSGMIYRPVSENPNQCFIEWIMQPSIGGWVPQFVIEKAIPMSIMDFVPVLKGRIAEVKGKS